jgi:hypothetical protein
VSIQQHVSLKEINLTKLAIDAYFPLLAEVDFSPQQQSLIFMPGTTSRCTSFTIINDSVVEQRESMIIRISSTQIRIDGVSDIVFLNIEDDDSKTYIRATNIKN